jgi:starch synthase
MARRIYACADFFLMPSRFEPCGTGQMISLRYATPPIVRRTGGLADSVVDEIRTPGEGTGFAFDAATPAALAKACEARLQCGPPVAARTIIARGWRSTSTGTRPAPQYVGCTSGRSPASRPA